MIIKIKKSAFARFLTIIILLTIISTSNAQKIDVSFSAGETTVIGPIREKFGDLEAGFVIGNIQYKIITLPITKFTSTSDVNLNEIIGYINSRTSEITGYVKSPSTGAEIRCGTTVINEDIESIYFEINMDTEQDSLGTCYMTTNFKS